MQGIGGKLGGVALGLAQPAQLTRDLAGADARGVQQGNFAHERHRGASRGQQRPAAAAIEPRVCDRAIGAPGAQ